MSSFRNRKLTRTAALAVLLFASAPAAVLAHDGGGRHGGRGWNDGGWHDRGWNNSWNNRGWNGDFRYRPAARGYRYNGYHYNGRHGDYRYRYRHRDHAGDVVLGAGLGLLAFGLLSAANQGHHSVAVAETPLPPPVYWRREAASYRYAPASPAAPDGCRMTREYQTRIVVDGRSVPAYGTACLQPDGSWSLGDAIPE